MFIPTQAGTTRHECDTRPAQVSLIGTEEFHRRGPRWAGILRDRFRGHSMQDVLENVKRCQG